MEEVSGEKIRTIGEEAIGEKDIFGDFRDLTTIVALGIDRGVPENCLNSALIASLAVHQHKKGLADPEGFGKGLREMKVILEEPKRSLRKAGVMVESIERKSQEELEEILRARVKNMILGVRSEVEGHPPNTLHAIALLGNSNDGKIFIWDARRYPGLFKATVKELAQAAGEAYRESDIPNLIKFHFKD